MKLTKFILPIAAILMVFAVVEASAQICVYDENHKYNLANAIRYKGDNLEFIKFCCESLGKCTQNYYADDKYHLTHIAAMYNRTEVLEYLVKEKHIPADTFPIDLQNGGYNKSYTEVMFAAKYKGPNNETGLESVKFLVSTYGPSIVTVKNKYNEDALILARNRDDASLISYVQSAWNKAKGYSYNQIEKEKAKLKNLLRPAAIQNAIAQNKTTKPFVEEKNLI